MLWDNFNNEGICKEFHQETEYLTSGKFNAINKNKKWDNTTKFRRGFLKEYLININTKKFKIKIKNWEINLESKGAQVPQVATLQISPVTIEKIQ